MLYNRKLDRVLIVIVPAMLFVYLSVRPHMRLQAEMPPEFVDAQSAGDSDAQALDRHLAEQYWKCASTFIQWKYTYGTPLPDTPPRGIPAQAERSSGLQNCRFYSAALLDTASEGLALALSLDHDERVEYRLADPAY